MDSEHKLPDTSGENKDLNITQEPGDGEHTTSADNVKLRRFGKKKRALIVAAIVVGIIASGIGGATIEHRRLSQNKHFSPQAASPTQQVASQIKDKKAADNPVKLENNTYLDKPKVLEDLKFFKHPDQLSQDSIQYFQIGTTQDKNKIVVAYFTPNGIGGPQDYVAVSKPNGSYEIVVSLDQYLSSLLETPSTSTTSSSALQDFKDSLSSNVTANPSLKLAELAFPGDATINGQALKASPYSREFLPTGIDALSAKDPALAKIGEQSGLSFYKATRVDTTFNSVLIYASVKGLYLSSYALGGPVISATNNLKTTWTTGENNASTYFSAAAGCGSRGSYITAKNITASQLTQVGTADGKTLYQLALTHPLVKELYEQDYAKGQYLSDTSLQNLSLQQFTDKHGYFLFQNDFGEYNVVQRGDMFVRGGCAKPVIYLYPERPTNVSVQVGASVTKSVPNYPLLGWQDVLAMPSGNLMYQGASYTSLFWEGFGHGQYPAVTSGTIVPRSEAEITIRTQLALQGLNQKEITDFTDFWVPKLPQTPYIKLSWLSLAQINELAPLSIYPKPQTLIRVFMDARGVSEPGSLATPSFEATPRQGFTTVEWGGLIKDGSVTKLQ